MSSVSERIVSFFSPLVWSNRFDRFLIDPVALEDNRAKYVVRNAGVTAGSLLLGDAFLPTSTNDYSALAIVVGVVALILVCASTVAWYKVGTMKSDPLQH